MSRPKKNTFTARLLHEWNGEQDGIVFKLTINSAPQAPRSEHDWLVRVVRIGTINSGHRDVKVWAKGWKHLASVYVTLADTAGRSQEHAFEVEARQALKVAAKLLRVLT